MADAPNLEGLHDAFNAHDLFEFSDGKVRRKDSFWKIVE